MPKRIPVTYTSTYADLTKTEKKFFDKSNYLCVFLDDGETWSPEGFIVALDEKDEEHQEIIEGDRKLRNIDSKYIAVDITKITKEDMQYLFSKYGCIYNQ